jgi:hypothetical protein
MDGSDPCYYHIYDNFDYYLRDVLQGGIDDVLSSENIEIDLRIWTNFRNELMDEMRDEIKDYYNNFIKNECPDRVRIK